jgi:hypothetical protein
MGYGLESQSSVPGRGKALFFTPHPPLQWLPGATTSGVNMPGRESNHSPPSGAEVNNSGAISLLPHTSSWMRCLINHKAKLPFYFYLYRLNQYHFFFVSSPVELSLSCSMEIFIKLNFVGRKLITRIIYLWRPLDEK